MTDQPAGDPTDRLTFQQIDALWDAVAIPGPTAPTFPMQHERVCQAVAEILDELTPAVPVVPVSSPPPDQTADRAAVLLWAADQIDAETRQAKADGVLEPDKFRPCRDASAQLRRLAGCQECASGLEHDVHCPTPESHNWGCGCPTDPVPADGPSRLAAEAQQPDTETRGPWGTRPACRCPHAADEHSVYGCVDGCACEWMPKRKPMDPIHILGIDATPEPVHKGGNADDCPACQTDGLDTIGPPYECPGPETGASGEEATRDLLRDCECGGTLPHPDCPVHSDQRAVCVCGHTRGEHIRVGGPFGQDRLLCDACDPNNTDNLTCEEFEAL